VMVDGQSVPACDTPLWAVQDKQVMTIESAKGPHQDAARRVLRQLQDAFVQEQAAQCGFCTSGILMSATVLLQQHAEPSLAQIHDALDRHLCRCGAHLRIVRAIQRASKALREEVAA
jgi:nicotinate dehydrogenase subunit A